MALTVSDLALRPWIQKAFQLPRHPNSVLNFFFGMDTEAPDSCQSLVSGSYIQEMQPFWFTSNKDYDNLCSQFTSVVREAGKGTLVEPEWLGFKGKIAKLILCDQLSRNCFRGNDEAFFYDDISLSLANDLAQMALRDDEEWIPSYTFFLTLSFMHSEDIQDHEVADRLLRKALDDSWCTSYVNWESQKQYLDAHTQVIRKFGRYPHRNSKKNRSTTIEEQNWLISEECPSWAKSQG